ncbi:MAG: hypothetical protein R6V07_10450 [Armatimonadota bacterium]
MLIHRIACIALPLLLATGVLAAAEHPLPLAASWQTGTHTADDQYFPGWQMDMIDDGHAMLPCFALPGPGAEVPGDDFARAGLEVYYHEPLRRVKEAGLPISLGSTQWESYLYRDESYLSLPAEQNPNVVTVDGEVQKRVSPFGPVEHWRELGRAWTDSPALRHLQRLYPDPPWVILLSNNEAGHLRWHQAEQSARYMELYGEGRSDEFKRRVVGDGYIERYSAFFEAMREGLDQWQDKAILVGYGEVEPHMGRWGQWRNYSLVTPERLSITPHIWDGCSGSYYVNDWQGNSDGWKGYCPQVSFMNVVVQLDRYREVNPDFFWEMSTWMDPKWKAKMIEAGQEMPPERYRAFVAFGMWLTRPRVVRHFVGWHIKREEDWEWYEQVVQAVDAVHDSETLAEFWREGELIANMTQEHPYQAHIPELVEDKDRWFALNTSLDPWRPHDVAPAQILNLEFRVWALAIQTGEEPNRRWLVYAHAPLGDEQHVQVEVPGHGSITMDIARGGSYFVIDEATGAAHAL